jgi:hypothetical protein
VMMKICNTHSIIEFRNALTYYIMNLKICGVCMLFVCDFVTLDSVGN